MEDVMLSHYDNKSQTVSTSGQKTTEVITHFSIVNCIAQFTK